VKAVENILWEEIAARVAVERFGYPIPPSFPLMTSILNTGWLLREVPKNERDIHQRTHES